MSYIVKVHNPCGCFLKFGLDEITEFNSLDEAIKYSKEVSFHANNSFCKTHFYEPQTQNEHEIPIKVSLRKRKVTKA